MSLEKPRRVYVCEDDYINKLTSVSLVKDLYDNEEICPFCHGTGLTIMDNRYGLTEEHNYTREHFPYKHQSISFCQHCYNGVVRRCKLCGEIIHKGYLRHDCEKQREIDAAEREQKEIDKLNKTPIAPEEIEKKCDYLFSEYYPYNEGFFADWDEFFDAWYDRYSETDKRPEFVWITKPKTMKIDASDIVDMATEDLYEDARDSISDECIDELQEYLNEWCKRCGVGETYFQDYSYKVKIPWQIYDKENTQIIT